MKNIRKALSHMLPTTSAASTSNGLRGPKNSPTRIPNTRARSMISAFFNILSLAVHQGFINHGDPHLARDDYL